MAASPSRTVGRALVGAFAGMMVGLIAALFLNPFLRNHPFEGPISDSLPLQLILGTSMVSFGVIAALFGRTSIRGKLGMVVQWTAWGAVVGVPLGAMIAGVSGEGKGAMMLGVMLGGPVAAILAAVIRIGMFEGQHQAKPRSSGGGARDKDPDGP